MPAIAGIEVYHVDPTGNGFTNETLFVVNTGNQKALKELLVVGEPLYINGFKQWGVIRKWQFSNPYVMQKSFLYLSFSICYIVVGGKWDGQKQRV
jgi:hypothetical protein